MMADRQRTLELRVGMTRLNVRLAPCCSLSRSNMRRLEYFLQQNDVSLRALGCHFNFTACLQFRPNLQPHKMEPVLNVGSLENLLRVFSSTSHITGTFLYRYHLDECIRQLDCRVMRENDGFDAGRKSQKYEIRSKLPTKLQCFHT